MFPWVYDFKWEPAHLVFLGVFFTVLFTLISLLVLAMMRTVGTLRKETAEVIRWTEDFHALPVSSQACRHELTGRVEKRNCTRGFDCRSCENHKTLGTASTGQSATDAEGSSATDILGFHMPIDRLYHRGHTWVRPQTDGTMTVGLDDFAFRLIGKPDRVLLPAAGSRLVVNGTAWRLRKGTAEIRILSPVEGEVIEQGSDTLGWYLRVRSTGASFDSGHLLEKTEIRPWIRREFERLQRVLSCGLSGSSMADGGMPVEDLASVIPEGIRDQVLGEMLLDP